MSKFSVWIRREEQGKDPELVQLPTPEAGYTIIDYVRECAYVNVLPREMTQQNHPEYLKN